jgi:hypothetical protein
VKDPRDTLQILAVFHYAVGAMMALVGLAPIVIGAVGAAMAAPGGDEAIRTEGAQDAAALGPPASRASSSRSAPRWGSSR